MNLEAFMAKLRLDAVKARFVEMADAYDLAHGVWEPLDGEILPSVIPTTARAAAFGRIADQMQSDGPVILESKLGAIVGDVSWGKPEAVVQAERAQQISTPDGAPPAKAQTAEWKLDEQLAELDLHELATNLAEDMVIRGIGATLSHIDEAGNPRISRLGGYLEPYYDPNDRDVITGLFQCDSFSDEQGQIRYWAKVYDWENEAAPVIRHWDNLDEPANLGTTPTRVTNNAPIPRFRIRHRARNGRVMGEMMTGAPLLKALWGTEARLMAAEELAAFPMLKTRGAVKVGDIGPAGLVEAQDAESDAEWMQPGNLEELRMQRDLREVKVNRHFAMPGGGLGRGNDAPSGEAIQEANRRTLQNSKSYADDDSGLLTEAVEDYCELIGIEPAPVVVKPNQDFYAKQQIETLTMMDSLGAIPFAVLARQIQMLVGNDYSDEELRVFIAENEMARKAALLAPQDGAEQGGLDESRTNPPQPRSR